MLVRGSPGGGRAWPLVGFWSFNEYSAPVPCHVPEACLGFLPNTAANPSSTPGAAFTNTAQTCSAGYTGVRCRECGTSYYQLNDRCYYCGSSTDQSSAIVMTLIAAVVAMLLLAFAVAFLAAMPLAYAITGFTIMQELAMAGVDGSRDAPMYRKELSTVFTWCVHAVTMCVCGTAVCSS